MTRLQQHHPPVADLMGHARPIEQRGDFPGRIGRAVGQQAADVALQRRVPAQPRQLGQPFVGGQDAVLAAGVDQALNTSPPAPAAASMWNTAPQA